MRLAVFGGSGGARVTLTDLLQLLVVQFARFGLARSRLVTDTLAGTGASVHGTHKIWGKFLSSIPQQFMHSLAWSLMHQYTDLPMSQNLTEDRLEEFLSQKEHVSVDDIDDPRVSQRTFREGVERSNDLMDTAWEARERNPVPWIHNSLRWRLLHMLVSDYADAAGMKGNFGVKTLENPDAARDLRIHDSAHLSVAYLRKRIKELDRDDANLLEAGTERLLDEMVADYRKRTEKLLLKARIEFGPDTFNRRTNDETKRLRPRIVKGRITPFSDIVSDMRGLHFPRSRKFKHNDEQTWNEPHIVEAREAFTEDVVEDGTPEHVAKLTAMLEFGGLSLSRADLKKLGLSQQARKLLVSKRTPSVGMIEPVREFLQSTVGEDATEELLEEWKNEERKVKQRKTFASELRMAIDDLNAEPSVLLPAFEMDPEQCTGHEVMRGALERGPSKKMPLLALIHILGTSDKERSRLEKLARKELRKRWEANRTQASHTLPAELQLCGIEEYDLGFNREELDQYVRLRKGEESDMKERDILERMRLVALHHNVLPALERWVESQEPTDLSRALELVAMRKGREYRELIRKASTSEATINAARRGELIPPHVTVKNFFEGAGVVMPAHVEADHVLSAAEQERREGIRPLGRAVNALIARSHRHAKTFRREREIDISARTFSTYAQHACETGCTNPKLIEELSAKADCDDREALRTYLELLHEHGDEAAALITWLDAMESSGKPEYVDGFKSLQKMLSCHDARSNESTIDELLARKDKLHRWKYGLKNDDTDEPEDLSSDEERPALKTLLLLPGTTRESLLSVSFESREAERDRHRERIRALTDLDDDEVERITSKLLAGNKRYRRMFYGDPSRPSSEERIIMLAERQEHKFRNLHLDEDCKDRTPILETFAELNPSFDDDNEEYDDKAGYGEA